MKFNPNQRYTRWSIRRLMLTVWKKLTSNLSGMLRFPIVPGLFHSIKRVETVPVNKIPAVKKRTNFV